MTGGRSAGTETFSEKRRAKSGVIQRTFTAASNGGGATNHPTGRRAKGNVNGRPGEAF